MTRCRFCNMPLEHVFVDLHSSPPANSFLAKEQLDEPEVYYPLKVMVCTSCWLVQMAEYKKATEIFRDDYVYYSSESPANVAHAKEYVEMICERFGYGKDSQILEIGSNDGYLLQWFKTRGCDVLGVDPAEGPADAAKAKGIHTFVEFFGSDSYVGENDLICGINVLAHQPDINDFIAGLKIALAPKGIITMEFPHLMNLVDKYQFDTIYHEHYSYFSFATICEIFEKHLLSVFDVDEIPEHGGSLRIYAEHSPSCRHTNKMRDLLLREGAKGMFRLSYYQDFQTNANLIKSAIVPMLIKLKYSFRPMRMIAAYGAAAKGATFLNYCGIKSDLVSFVVDRSPHKQGKYLPGSHIPVVSEDVLKKQKPAYVLILAWNLKDEIMQQLSYTRNWGCKFIVAIPELKII